MLSTKGRSFLLLDSGHDVPEDVSEARVKPQHRYNAGPISTSKPGGWSTLQQRADFYSDDGA